MFRNPILPRTTPAMPSGSRKSRHRHTAPLGPWPFPDIDDEIDADRLEDTENHRPMSASPCSHVKGNEDDVPVCWCKYPQSLFPNWTPRQQEKSNIAKVVEQSTGLCTVYYVDVQQDGTFGSVRAHEVKESNVDEFWGAILRERPKSVRCRALFIDRLSGPVLQMLGTRYNIEPLYFSSSLGWIPSRYQSNAVSGVGDHITITLTFVRTMRNPTTLSPGPNWSIRPASTADRLAHEPPNMMFDTHTPLPLWSNDVLLVPDLLALHMVRSRRGNTIISYHPGYDHGTTTAKALHCRFALIGRSVYWSSIFQKVDDPTLLLLTLMWHPLYCWDDVFNNLFSHICFLDNKASSTNDMELNHELHAIRAHLIHYQALLHDFRETIMFFEDTPFPGLVDPRYSYQSERISRQLLKRESANLLQEIQRLQDRIQSQNQQLEGTMIRAFRMTNLQNNMQRRTEAFVRYNSALKQILYLTMFFLPAIFVAKLFTRLFRMNIEEINPGTKGTLLHFFVVMMLITIWLTVTKGYSLEKSEKFTPSVAAK